MVNIKRISSIFFVMFNRIFSIILTSILVVFFVILILQSNRILLTIIYIMLIVLCFFIVCIFNIKLKFLTKKNNTMYVGLIKKSVISGFELIKTIKGNTPIIIFSYKLKNKTKIAFSMVNFFKSKEIFEELDVLSTSVLTRNND